MKQLYLDCGMGAAGDMLTAALLELLPDPDAFVRRLNALQIPGVEYRRETAVKCGITGTHMSVLVHNTEESEEMFEHEHEHHHHDHDHEHHHEHDHEHHHDHDHEHHHDHEHGHHHHHDHDHDHDHHHDHDHDHAHHHDHDHEHHHHEHDHDHDHDHGHGHHHHSSLHHIEHIVEDLGLPADVTSDIMAVYTLIAEAESHVHGVPVSEIHFHEVGTMDAVADVTAVCMLIRELAPDEIIASPVHVGSGHVHCAHGILPVPAPATAHILQGIPIYSGSISGELCTPTGAALLKHFVNRFAAMPVMSVSAIGYGMGKKDFERANCVRAMLGETEGQQDTVFTLSCNVDDMTAEEIGYAMDCVFEAGALEVFTVPVGMKKSRPGVLMQALCREQDRKAVVKALFRHTSTIGIRESRASRYVLDRTTETIETRCGTVRRKRSSGYGVTRSKYEYDDISRIASEQGCSLDEVRRMLAET